MSDKTLDELEAIADGKPLNTLEDGRTTLREYVVTFNPPTVKRLIAAAPI